MKQPPDDWAPLTQKGAPHAGWRPFKYGLIWAAISVAVVVLLATLHGLFLGFHPAPIYGSYGPGLNAAATMAVFVLVFRGLLVAGIGFAVGFFGSLAARWFRKGKQTLPRLRRVRLD